MKSNIFTNNGKFGINWNNFDIIKIENEEYRLVEEIIF